MTIRIPFWQCAIAALALLQCAVFRVTFAQPKNRFTVPPDFKVVETVRIPDSDKRFSLVNLCFDDKGRLLVSRERGPILLCINPDKNGVMQSVAPYCTQITNCQGMCWVKDALLLVGNGPKGTGLYRVRDTDKDDKTDKVELLHRFRGGMGEHGPHAILHGPDGWLYLVLGNHAWMQIGPKFAKQFGNAAKLADNSPLTRWPTGGMGPDQGKTKTTEDVLLPRLNDARGHAANILAPGGTIWRLDHEGKNVSLVAAGFRNHFDAAFNPAGELFTFDSDMEWDLGLPWYRAVRVAHCPPGADFVWRTGAANTPDYYVDSLPPLAETGRGSPVGVACYDHVAFPKKYHGAVFLADWSIGVIYAVHTKRAGASYKANVEKFCAGKPMNVSDLAVGPDGALYFTTGGRNSQGGVFRVEYTKKRPGFPDFWPQPLSAWSRARNAKNFANIPQARVLNAKQLLRNLDDAPYVLNHQIVQGVRPKSVDDIRPLLQSERPEIRSKAVWLLGVSKINNSGPALVSALKDKHPLVRRRACEALIRAGIEPPVEDLWPLLKDNDRFVRHAARLVLQRIDPQKWTGELWKDDSDLLFYNGVIALCHTHQASEYAEQILSRLQGRRPARKNDTQLLLDHLRTVQLALIHIKARGIWAHGIATRCEAMFPHKDDRVNKELAILLTQFQREKQLSNVPSLLVKALLKTKDRPQQIHYAYCLRLLKDGWSAADKKTMADWFEQTKTWRGGASFTPFLENIYRQMLDAYSAADRITLIANAEKSPYVALVLAQRLQFDGQAEMIAPLEALQKRLASTKVKFRELRQAVSDAIFRTVLKNPTPAHWPMIVRGLQSSNPVLRTDAVSALLKNKDVKPKKDDPAPYRALLTSVKKLPPKYREQAMTLMRHWTGRNFGAKKGKWQKEIKLWARWFSQTFPKAEPLPDLGDVPPPESKHKMSELLEFLQSPAGKKGDVKRGRLLFEKAQCAKCHKFGKFGEGVGPDLTALAQRFKREDMLEAIVDPSKVISDQYRSSAIITKKGVSIVGMATIDGDVVNILLDDASKITLKKSEIQSQSATLVSVMPERLFDTLSREEIADLFAFLESKP